MAELLGKITLAFCGGLVAIGASLALRLLYVEFACRRRLPKLSFRVRAVDRLSDQLRRAREAIADCPCCEDPFLPAAFDISFPAQGGAPVIEECGTRECAAAGCPRSILDGEFFCGYCAAELHPKLREALAVARANAQLVLHASLVRLARELLMKHKTGGGRGELIRQHGRGAKS